MVAAYYILLLLLSFILMMGQQFIPPLELFHGARINLLPALIAFVALTLDLPWSLGFAFFVGLVWDSLTIPFVGGEPGMTFGLTIVLLGIATLVMHGCRNWFLQGRFFLHPLFSGLLAFGLVVTQYLIISLKHGSFYFDENVVWRVMVPTIMNLCLAPLLLWALWLLAGQFGLQLRQTKTRRRYASWAS